MWLDMQGAELAMLKGATDLLSTIKLIYTEVEFIEAYKDQPLYKDIKLWLESKGFQILALDFDEALALEGKVMPSTGNYWGNALFINTALDSK